MSDGAALHVAVLIQNGYISVGRWGWSKSRLPLNRWPLNAHSRMAIPDSLRENSKL